MNAREGRPSCQEVGARQSARTTDHRTTARFFAHGSTVSDLAAWAIFVLIIVAIVYAFCALAWVVAP